MKARNRVLVPLLNAKLPTSADAVTVALDRELVRQGGWHFNQKTRLVGGQSGFDQAGSLGALLSALKATGETRGGGAVCRIYSPDELAAVDVRTELATALANFDVLIAMCSPSSWDVQVVADQDTVVEMGVEEAGEPFDPENIADGRRKVLAEVARRLGQASFRKKLFKAYDGRCAITGSEVANVLQAAHITPYLGKETNDVTNGILLRADIHTLFDLRLIRIEPTTMTVQVSEALMATSYGVHHGQQLSIPLKHQHRPSPLAIERHFSG